MVNYEKIARDARVKVLELIYKAGTSHIGSNFSAIDIMAVLFEKADPKKDEIILSAGWKAAAWYYFLWRKGIISQEELDSFCMSGGKFIGLVEPMNRWGLRFAGGSMGYGLPFGVGVALAKKMKGEEGKVYVLMSDGELQIGTTWESTLIASQHKLNNLVVIVDHNGLQAMGRTENILTTSFPKEGWSMITAGDENIRSGNKPMVIEECFKALQVREKFLDVQRPKIIIAHTTKGKGIPRWEGDNLWHYAQIKKDDYEYALRELNAITSL